MKTALLLFLFCSPVLADCIPWEINTSEDTLKGCGDDWQLYKARHIRVLFPGYTADRTPDGHGSCSQATSCGPFGTMINVLEGKTECWPQFDSPRFEEGSYSQDIHNRVAVQKLYECSPNFFAGPVECREHPTRPGRTVTVTWTCPVAEYEPPASPFEWPLEPVCSWGYLPGTIYCGNLY